MIVLISIIIIVLIIFTKFFKLQTHWKDKNVRFVKPWPFFGYMAPNVFRQKSFADIVQALYNTFPEQRYFGCYQFITPILMIRDPVLIKKIMVENFDAFSQHKNFIDADVDPIWAKNLFLMKGDEWCEMRSLMSSTFTSRKLKNMFEVIKKCAEITAQHYRKEELVEVEMKDIASRFVNDVIATAIFGIDCNSIENPETEFYCMTKEVTQVSFKRLLKFIAYTIFPSLAKLLNFRMLEPKHYNFYRNVIKESMEDCIKKGIVRQDMVYSLIETRNNAFTSNENTNDNCGFAVTGECNYLKYTKERKTEITDEEITAQAIAFLFSGLDTVSTVISHLIYELALNIDIQKKLRTEINSIQDECTYENLIKLKYLDMVVSETLRKWPSYAVIDRECVEPFTIEAEQPWENTLNVESKTLCSFPVFAIHRDPKIYPNPNQFDPERFNDENKHKIKQFTYLPFGAGPRSCIGSQFAVLEIKVFVFLIVAAFDIIKIDRTKPNLSTSRSTINLVFDDGFWIGLKQLNM